MPTPRAPSGEYFDQRTTLSASWAEFTAGAMIPAAPISSAFLMGTSAAEDRRTKPGMSLPAACSRSCISWASRALCSASMNSQSNPTRAKISATGGQLSDTIVPSSGSPSANLFLK
jgi:hypothetical protein